jgi:prolipoprotein diacylglyceryltransferase
LTQELDQIEEETTEGLNLAQRLLSRFTNNVILTQYFAYFSTIRFFVETSRQQVETTTDTLSAEDVPFEVIQEAGEELGMLLGRVLEVKINISRTKTRLDNWQ